MRRPGPMDRAKNNCIRSSGSDYIRETAGASQVARRRRGTWAQWGLTVGSPSIQKRQGLVRAVAAHPCAGTAPHLVGMRRGAPQEGQRPLRAVHHIDTVQRAVDVEGGRQTRRPFRTARQTPSCLATTTACSAPLGTGQERVTRRARERSRIYWPQLFRVDPPAGREQGAQRLSLRRTVWLSGSAGTPRPLDHRRGRTGVASRGPCSRLPEDQPG